ncbi:hypothetical protein HPB50_010687 [Hyalomma asiaticum]|uniref:Uncharacterized protein n=1 Tax=Hyalomma asiaticum TaxID=266040 RepID=A0ACB7SFT4_HYAAI|nr:hypothetical protein HPB50_010687 [Hyalomma asiaticum]
MTLRLSVYGSRRPIERYGPRSECRHLLIFGIRGDFGGQAHSVPSSAKELDVTATELVDRQDASDAARSRLVQLCREFKKTAPQGKVTISGAPFRSPPVRRLVAHQRQVDETGRLPRVRDPVSRGSRATRFPRARKKEPPAIGSGSAVSAKCLAHRERALFRSPLPPPICHVSTGQDGLSDGPIPWEPSYGRGLLLPKGRSDVRCLVSPLLRHFQAEVDRLGERSLAAEAAFLALYKRLLRAVSVAHSGLRSICTRTTRSKGRLATVESDPESRSFCFFASCERNAFCLDSRGNFRPAVQRLFSQSARLRRGALGRRVCIENNDGETDPPSPVVENRLERRLTGRLRKWTPD